MRREYTDYGPHMNIDFKLARLGNYPLVWRDSIRMFFVLRGSIIVGIENEEFTIGEDSIEIINKAEPYYIKSQDPNNLVLIIDIRPEFFKKFNDFAEYIHYYTDTLDGSRQQDYKYRKLREYIAMLLYEFLEKGQGYQEQMEEVLLKTMNHLLNNFHYLIYEEASLKEDDIQLERFTRIIYYLKQNYSQKVSLKEIAEREFLTPQYLSYKIKDTFGQSFNDFLNKIRVEESRKLLLDSEKSISEIALESGFSHSRYYNKHFLKIHGISPSDYRARYWLDQDQLDQEKDYDYVDLVQAQDYLRPYLEKYKRYNGSQPVEKKHLELGQEALGQLAAYPLVDLRGLDLFDLRLLGQLKSCLERLGLENLILDQDQDLARLLSYQEMEKLEIHQNHQGLDQDLGQQEALDLLVRLLEGENPRLGLVEGQGLASILSQDYFKLPAYFGLELYSKLGQDIIYQDPSCLATRSSQGYEILVYNQDPRPKKLSLNLHGLSRPYDYMIYDYKKDKTSIYAVLESLGGPKSLSPLVRQGLARLELTTSLGLIDKSNNYNFIFDLGPGDLSLIVLR